MNKGYNTQNDLLMTNLLQFYKDEANLQTMLSIINGESKISLRIVDWFATNYAKKYFTVYLIEKQNETLRFKVYNDYKLKLKAYSKRRFDPFCRWERINIPYKNNTFIQRNSTSKRNTTSISGNTAGKTRKKREELSVSAVKSIKKEEVEIVVRFD